MADETALTILDLKDAIEAPEERTRGTATGEAIRGDMAGEPRLEKIEVAHQAGLYEVPGGDPVKEFTGVIVAATRRNAFFPIPMEEAKEDDDRRPTCFSVDAVMPSDASIKKESPSCAVCPRNKDAKDRKSRDAAWDRPKKEVCGNGLDIAVLVPGCTVPYRLRLSATAFQAWDAHIQTIGTRGQYRYFEVVTTFKLQKLDGPGGSKYSKPVFELAGTLKPAARQAMAKLHADYLGILRAEPFTQGSEPSDDAREAARAARAAAKAAEGQESAI